MSWQVTYWDVGQGDACDIRTSGGDRILIDVGPHSHSQNPLPAWWMSENQNASIRLVLLTHNHSDHFGGLNSLLSNPEQQVSEVILPVDKTYLRAKDTGDLGRLISLMRERARQGSLKVRAYPGPGVVYEDEEFQLRIIRPDFINPDDGQTPNQTSLVIVLENADAADAQPILVWCGDVPFPELVDSLRAQHPVVMDGPHHGAPQGIKKTVDCHEVLRPIVPRYLYASVGRRNGYDHPSRGYLIDVSRAGATVCCSELCEHCGSLCDQHVLKGSGGIGLPQPEGSVQCRGSMRVVVDKEKGVIFDGDQELFEKRVRELLPNGYCMKGVQLRQS
mgnify:CR=1 FL=1